MENVFTIIYLQFEPYFMNQNGLKEFYISEEILQN